MRRRPIVLLLSRSFRDGVMAPRARELALRSRDRLDVRVAYRGETFPLVQPDLVYVFDSAPRELKIALRHRLRGVPVVIDTGDVNADLQRAVGASPARSAWLRALEVAEWRFADALVVRSESFREVLRDRGVRRPTDVIPDGVDLTRFRPMPPEAGRARLALAPEDLVAAVVGSIVWSPVQRTAYGWDLVEALPRTPDRVKAVIVGDGDGVARLRARARELGVAHRLLTPGRVPHDQVPELLAAFDAVLWTQTPDDMGRCRTTTKLPEYLACGKFVIASDVGEARRTVNGNGVRVSYRGGRDKGYVDAVANAIRAVEMDRDAARARGLGGIRVARRYDWNRIAEGFVGVVERTLAGAAR